MTPRFVSNLLLLVAGLLLVTATFAFPPPVVAWLGLAAGCLVVLVVLGAFLVPGRGRIQRGLDVIAVLAGGWTIVATRAYAPPTARWLDHAAGWLFAVLGLAGLVLGHLAAVRALPTDHAQAPAAGDGQVPRFVAADRVVAR